MKTNRFQLWINLLVAGCMLVGCNRSHAERVARGAGLGEIEASASGATSDIASPQEASAALPGLPRIPDRRVLICRMQAGSSTQTLALSDYGQFYFSSGNCRLADGTTTSVLPDQTYYGTLAQGFVEGGFNSIQVLQPTASTGAGVGFVCHPGTPPRNSGDVHGCYGYTVEIMFVKIRP